MKMDKLFDRKVPVGDFTFNKEIADIFDDMLKRSVPMYDEIQRILVELALNFIQPKTNIYDLGCSTGTTLILLARFLSQMNQSHAQFIGLDSSPAMLTKAKKKFEKNNIKNYTLCSHDLNDDFNFENASCVFINWTLQFVRPINRPKLLKAIYDGLNSEGIVIMVEKVVAGNSMLNRLYIDLYYNFKKRQGYSELEISKKREALENILVPYRVEENQELFKKAGFSMTDIFFKWYNFAGIIAVKT